MIQQLAEVESALQVVLSTMIVSTTHCRQSYNPLGQLLLLLQLLLWLLLLPAEKFSGCSVSLACSSCDV
jgi:hypothetical protein